MTARRLLKGIPFPILVLVAIDVCLVVAPVIDHWLGSPFGKVRQLLWLDGENTVQAWYSSVLWLCAAILFGLLAVHAHRARRPGTIAAAVFAAACLAFSIDEIVGVHEWLALQSDALLPGGDRSRTAFVRTGIWPLLVGVPVVAALVIIVGRMGTLFRQASPRGMRLLTIGLVLMFTGALLVELGVNLIERTPGNRGLLLAQLVVEEFLEMLGVSYVIWAGAELLAEHGITLQLPAATISRVVPAVHASRPPPA